MARDGLLIGEVAARTGVSRKALRLYEKAGILPAPRRTASRYRVYDAEALDIVAFVKHAQRLGFRLDEIKEIVRIRRSGRAPCPHVYELVRRKRVEIDRVVADLVEVWRGLRRLLTSWKSPPRSKGAICPHIERISLPGRKEVSLNGHENNDVPVPGVLGVSTDRDRRRRGEDR